MKPQFTQISSTLVTLKMSSPSSKIDIYDSKNKMIHE